MSHDLVRYDLSTNEPLQGVSIVDDTLDFHEGFEQLTDPLLKRYLKVRADTGYKPKVINEGWRAALEKLSPFQASLSKPEFLPTMCFSMIEILHKRFPKHHLVVSDFHELPDTVEGIDGPVVQTRYQESMVACSTYLVQPGWFDIFFPTNFELLAKIYQEICGRKAVIQTHREFLSQHGDVSATRTRSGENPMLSYYENVKFLTS